MRALSLWQPWANFVADGTKRYETRSWRTNYTGPIAIHASKNKSETLWSGLETEGPFGAIVAVATLMGCIPTETQLQFNHPTSQFDYLNQTEFWPPITDEERDVGDWTPGRWAWALRDVVKLPEPLPLRGYQGLWRLPSDLRRYIADSLITRYYDPPHNLDGGSSDDGLR